jgi:hypothetical protein
MVIECRHFRLLYQSRCWNLPLVLSIILSVLFYMGVTFLCHSLRYYVTLAPSFYVCQASSVASIPSS